MDYNIKSDGVCTKILIHFDDLSENDRKIADKIIEAVEKQDYFFKVEDPYLREFLSDTFSSFLLEAKIDNFEELISIERLNEIVEYFKIYLSKSPHKFDDVDKTAKYIVYNLYHLKKINYLLDVDVIEEIEINGPNRNAFVYIKDYGHCESNIYFTDEELQSIIKRIEKYTKKEKDEIIEAHSPDGSRIHVVKKLICPFGPSITIRKFKRIPYTIFDLINNETLSIEVSGLLWLATDGLGFPLNMLIVGGTSAGKTTLLNTLIQFCDLNERIVVIEDTLELDLYQRKNVVRMLSNEKYTLDDLIKSTLRMRPDRIIIGEVRGEEAKTLFTAMNIGHRGILGTLHASDSKNAILRLKSHPMNVPEEIISSVNLIISIGRITINGKTYRKVLEITELEKIDNKPKINVIYKYNPQTNRLERTETAISMFEKLAKEKGVSINYVMEELQRRIDILNELYSIYLSKGKLMPNEVIELFSKYKKDLYNY